MIIREIKNKEEWENFFRFIPEKTFLQSWNWGEFQQSLGRKIWRLGAYQNNQLKGIGLVFKSPIIQAGKYQKGFLFCPHGPLILEDNIASAEIILKAFVEKLKVLAKEEKVIFLRLAPLWKNTKENQNLFHQLGFRKAPLFLHPELTWQLNLQSSEEKLLQQMRKTTRYLIRKGLNWPGLEIRQGTSRKDINYFWQLYQETASRHHFVPFSKHYLQQEVLSFKKDKEIIIFSAFLKNELLASAIILFWQGIAFYHHGASSSKQPKVPAAYLIQWRAIQEAKKRQSKIYNFWGIAPSINKQHPWGGLTLFKQGFGGQAKEYLPTQDLALSWLYWPNWLLEKARRRKRRV